MTGPDYYQMLGVPRDAGAPDIRQAYVKLVKHAHPDLATANRRSTARLQDLQHAYRSLLDPDLRRTHDAELLERETAHAERLRRVQRRLRTRSRSARAPSQHGSAPRRGARAVNWRLVWLALIGAAVIAQLSAGRSLL